MSKIFDSHCHPQFTQYDADRGEMLARAKSTGVSMICIGTDLESSKKGIELAQQHENMWATAGIHPNDTDSSVMNKVHGLVTFVGQPKVVAIGEIGLDYYRTEGEEAQKKQKDLFISQLELAQKVKLPVVLHCRDGKSGSAGRAYPDMIEILKNYPDIKGVIHSCTASLNEAKQFLDLGFYLGFNGIITFAWQYDEVVKYVPLDRILLETDAPYLTPEPYRGERNEPSFIGQVVDKIAELKGVFRDEVIVQTTQNCIKLFKLA